jgi:hypothetical protein
MYKSVFICFAPIGFFDKIVKGVGGLIGGATEMLGFNPASSALDLATGMFKQDRTQDINEANSALQFARNKEMYRNRYQWQMEDMKKAGLNPILSAQMSAGGGPSVSLPSAPSFDPISPSTSALNVAQAGKVEAETGKIYQETTKAYWQAMHEITKLGKTSKEANKVSQEIKNLMEQHNKLLAEIEKVKEDKNLVSKKVWQQNLINKRLKEGTLRLEQITGAGQKVTNYIRTYVKKGIDYAESLIKE